VRRNLFPIIVTLLLIDNKEYILCNQFIPGVRFQPGVLAADFLSSKIGLNPNYSITSFAPYGRYFWNREAELPGGFEIDEEFKDIRLLDT